MPQVAAVLDSLLEDDLLDGAEVARVVDTTPRTISRWQRSEVAPRRESEERLLELKAVADLLRQHLRPEPARLWLRSPNPELDFEKPLDLVAHGEYRRVIGAISAMAEGVTA